MNSKNEVLRNVEIVYGSNSEEQTTIKVNRKRFLFSTDYSLDNGMISIRKDEENSDLYWYDEKRKTLVVGPKNVSCSYASEFMTNDFFIFEKDSLWWAQKKQGGNYICLGEEFENFEGVFYRQTKDGRLRIAFFEEKKSFPTFKSVEKLIAIGQEYRKARACAIFDLGNNECVAIAVWQNLMSEVCDFDEIKLRDDGFSYYFAQDAKKLLRLIYAGKDVCHRQDMVLAPQEDGTTKLFFRGKFYAQGVLMEDTGRDIVIGGRRFYPCWSHSTEGSCQILLSEVYCKKTDDDVKQQACVVVLRPWWKKLFGIK